MILLDSVKLMESSDLEKIKLTYLSFFTISNYNICCGSFCFAVTLQCFKFKRFLLELDYDYYAGAYPSINSLPGIYILLPHASISDFSVSQKHIFYYDEKNTVFYLL